jgi:hypothetical protein
MSHVASIVVEEKTLRLAPWPTKDPAKTSTFEEKKKGSL